MSATKGNPWKLIWISSLTGVVTLGIVFALISLSTFSGTTDASQGKSTDQEEVSEAAEGETGDEGEGKEPGEGQDEGESSAEDGEKELVPVETSEVRRESISSYLSTTANLEAENEARVLAEIEGLVVEILVEEGDRALKGDLLAQLDEGDKAIRVRKAALKVRNDTTNFERAQRMSASNLISEEEFEKLKYPLEVSRQELEEAEYNFSRVEIRAPFDGIVSERIIKVGARVKPADHLFSLVAYEPLLAKIYLPEKDVLDIQNGDEVLLTLNAVDGERFPGRISLISPIVDPGTGTVKVTVEVTRVPEGVRPGSFVTVNIVRETHADVVAVPRKAVIRELQENFVFVVEGEEAKKRDVVLGFEENGYVEILSGLASGERVVTAGQGGLKDGTKVQIIDT